VAEWCSDGGDAGNREELGSGKKIEWRSVCANLNRREMRYRGC
jgi:hypothetical protein